MTLRKNRCVLFNSLTYVHIHVYIYIFTHIKTYQEAILINMDIFIININFFVIFISNKNWQNHWGKKVSWIWRIDVKTKKIFYTQAQFDNITGYQMNSFAIVSVFLCLQMSCLISLSRLSHSCPLPHSDLVPRRR